MKKTKRKKKKYDSSGCGPGATGNDGRRRNMSGPGLEREEKPTPLSSSNYCCTFSRARCSSAHCGTARSPIMWHRAQWREWSKPFVRRSASLSSPGKCFSRFAV